jgi:NAD(P)H-dependent FMN reductase
MPKLHVILASTRPGRAGEPIADWFVERAAAHGAFDVELVDLAEVALPFMDEPNHPRLRRYTHEHTKAWSARVDSADAFVFVTPEYNYGLTAPLKNAIDYLHFEWQHKPVGFVSYGGVAAGTRAVQMLKQRGRMHLRSQEHTCIYWWHEDRQGAAGGQQQRGVVAARA